MAMQMVNKRSFMTKYLCSIVCNIMNICELTIIIKTVFGGLIVVYIFQNIHENNITAAHLMEQWAKQLHEAVRRPVE